MPEIQTLLRNYGEHLEELAPAITIDEVEQALAVPPKPVPTWKRPVLVAAMAAVGVLLVIGGLSVLVREGLTDDTVASASNATTIIPATTVPPITSVAVEIETVVDDMENGSFFAEGGDLFSCRGRFVSQEMHLNEGSTWWFVDRFECDDASGSLLIATSGDGPEPIESVNGQPSGTWEVVGGSGDYVGIAGEGTYQLFVTPIWSERFEGELRLGQPAEPPSPQPAEVTLPPLGDEFVLDETRQFLVGVALEVAGQLGMTDYSISFGNGPDDTPPTSVSIEETSVHSFPSADDASRYLASKEAEERAAELEQPEPPDLGDEAVAFHGTGWAGSQVVFLVRIESHVVEVSLFEPEQLSPPEELAVFVAALESPTSPGFSAYGEPLVDPFQSGADEIGVSYGFGAWRLPVGDVGGEPAEITFGYERSGDPPHSCTYWWGDVEPHVLITYTQVGDGTVNVHVDDWFEGTQEDLVVGEDDPDYLAASESCDRYPTSAEAWGIDKTSYSVETVVDSEFQVYPTGDNAFVLLAPVNYDVIVEEVTPNQLALLDIPPGVTVTEFDVGVGFSGEIRVLLELEGLRADLEAMFGIDLSAMPNERIGLSFGLE